MQKAARVLEKMKKSMTITLHLICKPWFSKQDQSVTSWNTGKTPRWAAICDVRLKIAVP
jgi:hypothetical protein